MAHQSMFIAHLLTGGDGVVGILCPPWSMSYSVSVSGESEERCCLAKDRRQARKVASTEGRHSANPEPRSGRVCRRVSHQAHTSTRTPQIQVIHHGMFSRS